MQKGLAVAKERRLPYRLARNGTGICWAPWSARESSPPEADKYLRISAAPRREGLAVTSGFGMSHNVVQIARLVGGRTRHPEPTANSISAPMHLARRCRALPCGSGSVGHHVGRNHRGFVESLIAAKPGSAPSAAVNTAARPRSATRGQPRRRDAVTRRGVHRFGDRALTDKPDTTHVGGGTDHPATTTPRREWSPRTSASAPSAPARRAGADSATAGNHGNPRAPKHPWGQTDKARWIGAVAHRGNHGGGRADVSRLGFRPMIFAASRAARWVTGASSTRKSPSTYRRHQATGLCVVPVMSTEPGRRRRTKAANSGFARAVPHRVRVGCGPNVVTNHGRIGGTSKTNYNATKAA